MSDTDSLSRLRARCQGLPPLSARLDTWMSPWLNADRLTPLIDEHGSPLNLLCTSPFADRVKALRDVGQQHGVDLDIFFARKANKCLSFVEAMIDLDGGIDIASETELDQTLASDCPGERVVCTAAIKSERLLAACLEHGVTVAIDNSDELALLKRLAESAEKTATVAFRLSGFNHRGATLDSRFGMQPGEVFDKLPELDGRLRVDGLHFHLHGYSADERMSALVECFGVIDRLRDRGHQPNFIDMGGGFPVCYLPSAEEWRAFWEAHKAGLLGEVAPTTYQSHGLGLSCVDGQIIGVPNVYPYYQEPTGPDWLSDILQARTTRASIADELQSRDLTLRCEPGRALLDGAGFTVARVEFTKQRPDGDWYVGLSMNRTQCRTGSDDFLVDPIVLRPSRPGASQEARDGFLVGAYCTEAELLSLRRLRFPLGIARGDLVVFPNTAGYFMHFLESRSHQFPLARNLFVGGGDATTLDPIDSATEVSVCH
ncbi:MAG: Y4yA family PLP-dependent enzyme [Planctomycetota bacterium]